MKNTVDSDRFILFRMAIVALTFFAGLFLGLSEGENNCYKNNRKKIELGYFASPEEIKNMENRKAQWETQQKSVYGITENLVDMVEK
jgi:hypothetical protein